MTTETTTEVPQPVAPPLSWRDREALMLGRIEGISAERDRWKQERDALSRKLTAAQVRIRHLEKELATR